MKLFALAFFLSLGLCLWAQQKQSLKTWGDQGNGTYINPVLNADYSDPDVVRVGDDYYMICSEFHFMGMPVLHSKDLVNWTIVSRIYDRIDFDLAFNTNDRYAGGSWAPSIRYHDNKFWVYFCTIDEGLFMTTADKAEGPWDPLTQVVKIDKWEDPCPFWDDDGQAYLIRSRHRAGPLIMHKMSADGKTLLDDGFTVYTGPVAEGPKMNKWNGYYYISIPEGGVAGGWQTVLRSKNVYGPYEKKVVLETGSTQINGPHQGSLIETSKGEWWFMHFQLVPQLGRVVHLQPMYWENDWPVIGVDIDRNGIGEPVFVWKKPDTEPQPMTFPQTSDNFDFAQLGFQWAWNHNPVDQSWSLEKNPGKLMLEALFAPDIMKARNTLTQKVMGNGGEAVVFLDGRQLADGQKAGICMISKPYALLGLKKEKGQLYLFTDINGEENLQKVSSSKIYLKLDISNKPDSNQFYYSMDNKKFHALGQKFQLRFGHWKGPKIGLFSFNEIQDGGTALFDDFRYDFN
ncbi:MAG: glycoside hydrolase 43 family protein [Mangrovibacterium sp.]